MRRDQASAARFRMALDLCLPIRGRGGQGGRQSPRSVFSLGGKGGSLAPLRISSGVRGLSGPLVPIQEIEQATRGVVRIRNIPTSASEWVARDTRRAISKARGKAVRRGMTIRNIPTGASEWIENDRSGYCWMTRGKRMGGKGALNRYRAHRVLTIENIPTGRAEGVLLDDHLGKDWDSYGDHRAGEYGL